jgi:hypothetical protein
MDAAELVNRLRARGARLEVDGETLVVSPRSVLTEADRQAIRAMKPAILALLTRAAPPQSDPAVVLAEVREARRAWWGACFEAAEALGWPTLDVRPGVHVGPGEHAWRLYLARAALGELHVVLLRLRVGLSQVERPGPAGS